MPYLLGRVIAFKKDDDYYDNAGASVELTEVEGGRTELAFDMPGNVRVYVSVHLPTLVSLALAARAGSSE